jgi:hypothetical protein
MNRTELENMLMQSELTAQTNAGGGVQRR